MQGFCLTSEGLGRNARDAGRPAQAVRSVHTLGLRPCCRLDREESAQDLLDTLKQTGGTDALRSKGAERSGAKAVRRPGRKVKQALLEGSAPRGFVGAVDPQRVDTVIGPHRVRRMGRTTVQIIAARPGQCESTRLRSGALGFRACSARSTTRSTFYLVLPGLTLTVDPF